MNRRCTFAGLSSLTLNMYKDDQAGKPITGIGSQRSGTRVESKGRWGGVGRPMGSCGQAEGIKARVIIDSESSTGL